MKTDLRVLRTRHNIKEAFITLMEEKDFELITIKDITERGMMNRGTFYAHYMDKYDLMDQLKEELLQHMSQIIDDDIDQVMKEAKKSEIRKEPYNISVNMIEFINKEYRLFYILLVKQGDFSFQKSLKMLLMKVIDSHFKNGSDRYSNQYVASYMGSANLGVLQQWLENGRVETPSQIGKIIADITLHGPINILMDKSHF